MKRDFYGKLIESPSYIDLTKLQDIQPVEFVNYDCFERNKVIDTRNNNYYVSSIETYLENNGYTIIINYQNTSLVSRVVTGDEYDIYQTLDDIEFDGTLLHISTNSNDTQLINDILHVINTTVNAVFMFRNNSSKNTLDKDLIFVNNMEIKYNRVISYKQFQLDLELSDNYEKFNYVYITPLNRYYYVDSVLLMKNFYTFNLSEDVLNTWKNLIVLQTAFVTRNQYTYNNDMVDDLVKFDYDKDIQHTQLTPTVNLFPSTVSEENSRRSCVIVTVRGKASS